MYLKKKQTHSYTPICNNWLKLPFSTVHKGSTHLPPWTGITTTTRQEQELNYFRKLPASFWYHIRNCQRNAVLLSTKATSLQAAMNTFCTKTRQPRIPISPQETKEWYMLIYLLIKQQNISALPVFHIFILESEHTIKKKMHRV